MITELVIRQAFITKFKNIRNLYIHNIPDDIDLPENTNFGKMIEHLCNYYENI